MIDRKTEIQAINGTPVKRIILSIISDYDLKTGLCELVDNALDQWSDRRYSGDLTVELSLDIERQLISVRDNAGGVGLDDLELLISPGRSRNNPSAVIIGIFGVGGKRSAIALAEHTEIKTRFKDQQTHELDITPTWIESDNWFLPAYAIPNIEPGTTQVSLSHLRSPITEQDVDALRVHLGQTYDWFLRKGCTIRLNDEAVAPISFENWAFPPEHVPRKAEFTVDVKGAGHFSFEITAGLIRDRIPEENNYGVYFYCNHRLIQKEVKTREVGYFVSSEAGVPHSDVSLCRTIVRIEGPAKGMPWTSNKSGINFDHPVFRALRSTLIDLNSHFSKLSRRFKEDWPGNVTRYDTGIVEVAQATETPTGRRLILPAVPRETRPRGVRQARKNRAITEKEPWTIGLVEAIDAVDLVERYQLETKNRIALILLDSNFEIALKEFIVHRKDLFPAHEFTDVKLRQLFGNRTEVIRTVRSKISFSDDIVQLANHYYDQRNKLIHERATVNVSDRDIRLYRTAVESVLGTLFNLEFEQ
jgi:histidine kinase/DNA gyrase B/HSP90-like ATPase